jgi:hypothetical protein
MRPRWRPPSIRGPTRAASTRRRGSPRGRLSGLRSGEAPGVEPAARDDVDDLRLDVATLRALIDRRLDNGAVSDDDLILVAAANLLRERQERLADLERGTDGAPTSA